MSYSFQVGKSYGSGEILPVYQLGKQSFWIALFF